jgi:DNA-binding NarL/FixJ family response regulator
VTRPASAAPALFFGPGPVLSPPLPARDAVHVWRELAGGRCRVLFAADRDGARHLVIAVSPGAPAPEWERLAARDRRIVALAADGVAQKAIAIELGLAFSTVSRILRDARRSLGLANLAELARAYRALA